MPLQRLENGSWPHAARLPLGCGWTGHCTAPGHEGEVPAQHVTEAFCNLGYASGCSWSPVQRTSDAIRFAVASPATLKKGKNESQNAQSQILRLLYACERDHRPVSHGELEFDLAEARWSRPHDDARIQKMAECFLETYLKRKA
jgi:hypothetical protein